VISKSVEKRRRRKIRMNFKGERLDGFYSDLELEVPHPEGICTK